jgi:hypothetical protein
MAEPASAEDEAANEGASPEDSAANDEADEDGEPQEGAPEAPARISQAPALGGPAAVGQPEAKLAGSQVIGEDDGGLPFGASISLSNSIGFGTFLGDFNKRPQYDIGLSFSPYYRIADHHQISLSLGVTKNVVANADSGVTAEGQTLLSDLSLTYSWSEIYREPVTGLGLGMTVSLSAPTSLASQHRSLILGTRLSLNLGGKWDWFSAGYRFSFGKNFHEYSHPVVDNPAGGSLPICIDRDQFNSDQCVIGGNANSEFSFGNSISLGFHPTDALTFGLGFGLSTSLSYDVNPDDELTSENAVPGRGQRDSMQGSISASYQINKYLGASMAVVTAQAPKNPDNQGFRFPFFRADASNATVFDLSLTGSF